MKTKNLELGFSLVELIVVVAIIGILATLVVPMYSKFSYRARTSEAKTLMTGLHAAEKSFHAEFNFFHNSFSAIGFSPEGNLRYNIGFGDENNPAINYVAYGYKLKLQKHFQLTQ